jgi:dipeptidyl aminopeptidase/acylaminoacyl peptidase
MHKRSSLTRLTALLAILLLCPVFKSSLAQAQESSSPSAQSPSAQIDSLLRGEGRARSISQVALSPDGKRLAWTESRQLFVSPYDDLTKPQRITAATSPDQRCSDADPVWSPDSSSLAFFSDCASADGQNDLYLSHLDSNPPSRITELKGYVHEPAFSPDGSKIAFLYVEGATRPAGALAAMKPPAGVIGEEGIEVQRVAVVPSDGSKPANPDFVTPANLHAFEFDWAPDSKSLAFIAAEPPGENNWWTAKLYKQELSGDTPHVVLDPVTVSGPLHGLQIAVPRWSPDGKSIAFIGGLMSDQGSTGGDVYLVSSAGGEPRDLTPGLTATPQWITWNGNQNIDISEISGGDSQVSILDLDSGRSSSNAGNSKQPTGVNDLSGDSAPPPDPFIRSSDSISLFKIPASIGAGTFEGSLSATADRSLLVFSVSSFDRAPEIYAVDSPTFTADKGVGSGGLNHPRQLTHFNDGVKPFWGQTDSIEWSNDGFHIQGWLMLPRDYDPHKKYPLIVEVHGGPAAAETSRWSGRGGLGAAAFSALGYFVLMPNPRGSFGQGEAFTQANRKDFGYGDLRDILAGVDTVLKKYPIDPNRVGLTGWSYGGFMSMFAVTQTHRFRAAVAGAGISDWLSYYGENSIDEWMIPYFGASVYDDPAVYAKMSAINYIKNVTTPTLAVVGDRDGECPAPQSFEFWHALRDQHVPTELVVYPNEGHGFVNPEHRRDVLDRAVNWFAKYMPAEGQ